MLKPLIKYNPDCRKKHFIRALLILIYLYWLLKKTIYLTEHKGNYRKALLFYSEGVEKTFSEAVVSLDKLVGKEIFLGDIDRFVNSIYVMVLKIWIKVQDELLLSHPTEVYDSGDFIIDLRLTLEAFKFKDIRHVPQ